MSFDFDINNPNSGHGHVRPRPDGMRTKCGGPDGWCTACKMEKQIMTNATATIELNAATRLYASSLHGDDAEAAKPEHEIDTADAPPKIDTNVEEVQDPDEDTGAGPNLYSAPTITAAQRLAAGA
ncbi:hypothetical protein BcepSauron_093 [Burkholderia phage BcepSauron]|uniref:Uncharacterized protein n=1 Tax=Burkholderia phage BcepSauron TaxID=2530033 RepID=A0A482MMT8_9CAUD|nr:hypothetical protein H1O17_gp093 [Burkholderia phage BcepSauron]QBQ74473.1 hypothetical protein BcepSauron_093 [Burkholderia phage BcepSauron]